MCNTSSRTTGTSSCLFPLTPPYLDDFEAEVAFVQHDDLILVGAVIDHVPQREQRVAAGQHGLSPGWVALVADDQVAAVVCDGFVQDGRLLCLLQTREVILKRHDGEPSLKILYYENDVQLSVH